MNCFICEMSRTCELCLDLLGQKKTFFTDNSMLRGKPLKEKHQMLPH